MNKNIKWSSNPPSKSGIFWFYGDPYKGQMGIDYKEHSPKTEPKLFLVTVRKISNGFLAVTEGQIIPLKKFNKRLQGEGYVGYWIPASLPIPPLDTESLFV